MADKKVPAVRPALTAEEQRFCGEFLVDFHPVKAARRAGIDHPMRALSMLARPEVQARIREISFGLLKRTDIAAEDVIEEMQVVGFSNMDDYVDRTDGSLRFDFRNVSRAKMGAIKTLTTEEFLDEDRPVRRIRVELWDKPGSLRDLGRYFGIFKQPENVFNVALVLSADEVNA